METTDLDRAEAQRTQSGREDCPFCGGKGFTLGRYFEQRPCACQMPSPKPFVRGEKLKIQNAPSSLEQSVAERHRTKWSGGR